MRIVLTVVRDGARCSYRSHAALQTDDELDDAPDVMGLCELLAVKPWSATKSRQIRWADSP
jgi:hypothetical protein